MALNNDTDPRQDIVSIAKVCTDCGQIVTIQTRDTFLIIFFCILGTPINLVGTVSNIINISMFVKMGFKETINISLFALSISDLCGLVTSQWLNICFNPLLMYSDNLPFDSFEIQYLTAGKPHIAFARVTGFITAFITFERCMCVVRPLKVKDIFTPRVTVVVLVAIFVATAGPMVPLYFVHDLGWKFFPDRNRTLLGLIFKENRPAVMKISDALNNTNSFLSFILVSISTVTLVQKLRSKSKWRTEAAGPSTSEHPEKLTASTAKDRKVIVMVSTISSIFVVCFLPVTLYRLASLIIPGLGIVGKYSNLTHCIIAIGFLLEEINASVNIFIYYSMSSKFRSKCNHFVLRRVKNKEKRVFIK